MDEADILGLKPRADDCAISRRSAYVTLVLVGIDEVPSVESTRTIEFPVRACGSIDVLSQACSNSSKPSREPGSLWVTCSFKILEALLSNKAFGTD